MFDLNLVAPCKGTVGVRHCLRAQNIYFICGYNAAYIGEKPFPVVAGDPEPDGKGVFFAELPTYLDLALFIVGVDIGTIFDMDCKAPSACYETYYVVAGDRVAAFGETYDQAVDALDLNGVVAALPEWS